MNSKKIMRELQQPFGSNDLEWRVQSSGEYNGKVWARIIAYVTSRAIQSRLDNVVGVFNWKNEFKPLPNSVGNGSMCGISIKFDGEWIDKWDGADNTQIESTKGGLSASMKRAGVEWGIGRYLYDVKAVYAICINESEFKGLQRHEKEQFEKVYSKDKNKKTFYWKAPELEDRFKPQKRISKSLLKTLKELITDTESNADEICRGYGVDYLTDLFINEAGEIINILTKRKEGQNEQNSN